MLEEMVKRKAADQAREAVLTEGVTITSKSRDHRMMRFYQEEAEQVV